MTREQIIQKTNDFLIHTLDIEESLITPDSEIKRDIGFTSVDIVATAAFVEDTFNCPIVMAKVKAIITLDDLYDYIEQNLREKPI